MIYKKKCRMTALNGIFWGQKLNNLELIDQF